MTSCKAIAKSLAGVLVVAILWSSPDATAAESDSAFTKFEEAEKEARAAREAAEKAAKEATAAKAIAEKSAKEAAEKLAKEAAEKAEENAVRKALELRDELKATEELAVKWLANFELKALKEELERNKKEEKERSDELTRRSSEIVDILSNKAIFGVFLFSTPDVSSKREAVRGIELSLQSTRRRIEVLSKRVSEMENLGSPVESDRKLLEQRFDRLLRWVGSTSTSASTSQAEHVLDFFGPLEAAYAALRLLKSEVLNSDSESWKSLELLRNFFGHYRLGRRVFAVRLSGSPAVRIQCQVRTERGNDTRRF